MITPIVGRHVHCYLGPGLNIRHRDQVHAAIITYVWNDRLVNLAVFDSEGNSTGLTKVQLLQGAEGPERDSAYCQWMPYQKGQAAKTEQLEAELAAKPRLPDEAGAEALNADGPGSRESGILNSQ